MPLVRWLPVKACIDACYKSLAELSQLVSCCLAWFVGSQRRPVFMLDEPATKVCQLVSLLVDTSIGHARSLQSSHLCVEVLSSFRFIWSQIRVVLMYSRHTMVLLWRMHTHAQSQKRIVRKAPHRPPAQNAVHRNYHHHNQSSSQRKGGQFRGM